jgi:CheY-like chemotaxis protein
METEKIKTIVLINDEEIIQKQYTRVMKRSDLVENILSFTHAKDMLEHMRTKTDSHYDVILLDIKMPCMNGFEFLEEIEKEKELQQHIADTVIIMFSTSMNPNDKIKAEQNRLVSGFINNPLNSEVIENIFSIYKAHKKSEYSNMSNLENQEVEHVW